MSNNFKMLALIIFGLVFLFVFNDQYKSYNLNKTVLACMAAQKKTSNSLTAEESKKFCEENIRKMMDE